MLAHEFGQDLVLLLELGLQGLDLLGVGVQLPGVGRLGIEDGGPVTTVAPKDWPSARPTRAPRWE